MLYIIQTVLRLITFERENNGDGILNELGFNEALDLLVNFPEEEENKLPGTIKVTTPISKVSNEEVPLEIETDLTRKQEEEREKTEARRKRSSVSSPFTPTDVYEDPLLTQSVLDTVVEKSSFDNINVKTISEETKEMNLEEANPFATTVNIKEIKLDNPTTFSIAATEASKDINLEMNPFATTNTTTKDINLDEPNPFATTNTTTKDINLNEPNPFASTTINTFNNNNSLLSSIPVSKNSSFGVNAFSDINTFNSMSSMSNMLDDMSSLLDGADMDRRSHHNTENSNNNKDKYNEEDMFTSPWA